MAVSKLKFNADGSVSFTKPLKTGSDSISGNMVLGRGEGDDGAFGGDNAGVDNNNDTAGGQNGKEAPDLSSNFMTEDKDDKTVSLDVGVTEGAEKEKPPGWWDTYKKNLKERAAASAPLKATLAAAGFINPPAAGTALGVVGISDVALAGMDTIDDMRSAIDDSPASDIDKAAAHEQLDQVEKETDSSFNATDTTGEGHGDGNDNNRTPIDPSTDGTTLADAVNTTGLTTTTPSTNQAQALGPFGSQAAPPQSTPNNAYKLYSEYVDKALGLAQDGTMDDRTAFFADQAAQNTAANNKAADEYEKSIQFINERGGAERQKYQDRLDTLDYIQGQSGQNYRTTLGGLESDLRDSTGVLTPQQTRVAGLGTLSGISKMQREQHEGLNQFNKDRRLSELEDITGATTRGASGYDAATGLLDRGTTNALGLRDNRITAADKAYANAAAQAPGNSALATLSMLSEMAGQQLTAMTGVEKANIAANASMSNAATQAAASRYGTDVRAKTALDQLTAETELRKLGYGIDQQRVDQGEQGGAEQVYAAIRATPVLLDAVSKGMTTVEDIIETISGNIGEDEDVDTFMQRFDWGTEMDSLDTEPYRYDTGLPGTNL